MNKTYALISNGTVINIVAVDAEDDHEFLVAGTIEAAIEVQQVQIGWGWSSDGGFVPPASTEAAEEAISTAEAAVLAKAVADSNLDPALIQQINAKLGR